jgi:hypothetical protein
MQARKICIVIDENTFEPIENYENFMCDTVDFTEGFIRWQYFRWAIEDVEPSIKDYFYYDTHVEVYMKNSPFAMMNMNMDMSKFDIQSKNYRMEALTLFAFFVISSILSIFCFCYKSETFFSITEEQRIEVERIDKRNIELAMIS